MTYCFGFNLRHAANAAVLAAVLLLCLDDAAALDKGSRFRHVNMRAAHRHETEDPNKLSLPTTFTPRTVAMRTKYCKSLPLDKVGLEIAPYFNPLVLKSEHADVYYTDYVSYPELREKAKLQPHVGPDDVVPIDFVWTPGKSLKESVPNNLTFDYVVSSNVVEHTPNTIAWIRDILEVVKPGGVVLFVVPDKRACFDYFRPPINVADLLDAWLRDVYIPSPRQVFEFLSHSIDISKPHTSLETSLRPYTDAKAMEFAVMSVADNYYLDAHTFSYTPQEFVEVYRKLVDLGVFNVDVSEPVSGEGGVEFLVTFTKRGEPDHIKFPYLTRLQEYHKKVRACRASCNTCTYGKP